LCYIKEAKDPRTVKSDFARGEKSEVVAKGQDEIRVSFLEVSAFG
jgi:hypothetical protein